MLATKKSRLIACLLTVVAYVLAAPSVCLTQSPGGAEPTKVHEETAPSPTVLLPPSEEISPIQTETIEKAGQKIEQKIEDIGNKASHSLVPWVGQDIVMGISWLSLVLCLLALLLVGVVDRIVRAWMERRVRALSPTDKPVPWTALVLEAFSKPLSLFIWAYGLFGALSIVLVQMPKNARPDLLKSVAGTGADIAGSVAVIWVAYRLVVLSDVRIKEWAGVRPSKIDQLLVGIVGKTLRIAVVILGSIMVIQNVTGIQMGPLIASLGLGGLAIALAGKDSVANFFGTLTIIFDKPFQIGDQIVIDKFEGTVESVGFRSTRIRTDEGNLLSMPNSKVIDSPLTNVGRRRSIRWVANIGISYETRPDKVRRAVEILEEILHDHEGMRDDLPPRVFFNAFKDWSLNITVQAWYHPPTWWDYQAWLQKTCMEILERFGAEGIRFALPSQVMHMPDEERRPFEVRVLKGESAESDE